ncbi:MAG: hypothetical protein JNL28_01110 [Planctomycetes bacterium]|nr:hypothetical protein [Planctomycetota bacterium]
MSATLMRLLFFVSFLLPASAQTAPGTPFCLGDGSIVACPCGPNGAPGHGCANLDYASGAQLLGAGVAGASLATDTLVLTASNIAGVGWFLQANGASASPIPFGHGLLCAAFGVHRLSLVFPTGGVSTLPGGPNPMPIHIEGMVNPGETRHYQCWYRDPIIACGTAYNITPGYTVTWGP